MQESTLNLKEKWLKSLKETLVATDDACRGVLLIMWEKSIHLPRKKKKKMRKKIEKDWNILNELSIK